MFAFASRFRLTVLFVVLASSLVLAHSDAHNVKRLKNARRHAAVNAREYNNTYTYEKRFENTRFTFFPVGQNACGSFDHDSDFIVAINTHQWDGGSHCYEKITIDYQGKSTGAMITDECEECPYGAIDLSPSLFSFLAGSTDPGQIYGSWNFGGGAPPTVTTMPDKPTSTSTTHQQPTSTPSPTPTPTPSPTTHKTTSHKTSSSTPTSTSTSTSSVAPSTTSSSVEPTTTVVSFDTGTLDSFSLAMLQLAGLQNAIFANPNIGA